MKTQIGLLATILTLTALSATAQVQNNESRWGFEISTGASYGTADIGDANLKTGLAIEGLFHYRILEHTGVYAGWGWKNFSVDQSFAGSNMDFEENGYIYGIQFKHPFAQSKTSYVIRAGGIYNHIEIENSEGDLYSNSGHGLGWQVAGGIELPLGRSWALIPTIKYSSLSRDFESDADTFNSSMNTLSTQVGFFKNF